MFSKGGENMPGHTCITLFAGRNLGYVIIWIVLSAKTNFQYVKNAFTLRSKLLHIALSHSMRSKSCLLKLRLKYAKGSI